MSKPLVSILSITYNHEKYVAQALESFVMQQADFDYEVIIADDASPDNTQAVIQKYADKYPDIIKPILREKNLGMNPNFLDALSRCQGKYIAMCEGDDYWTDHYKLQKQVDFLEGHPEYSCIHSELGHEYTQTGKFVERHWERARVTEQEGDIFDSLLIGKNSMIYLCTLMFRTSLIKNNAAFDHLQNHCPMRDTSLALHLARFGKVGYIAEPTAVRRVLSFSATQGQSLDYSIKFREDGAAIFQYFLPFSTLSQEELDEKRRMSQIKDLRLYYQFVKSGKIHFFELLSSMPARNKNIEIQIMYLGLSYGKFSYRLSQLALKIIRKLRSLTKILDIK